MNKYPRSPLRYPGGKSRAVDCVLSLIPETEKVLCSPFLGGGSIELACSTRMMVYGYDVFEPLVEFWQELISNPEKMATCIRLYFPLLKDEFYELQKSQSSLPDKTERAAAFFVLNRSSFSGSTLSGGMSPNHPRFNISSIRRVQDFRISNFVVEKMDYRESVVLHKNDFLYLDPPYMNGQGLYGRRGDTHRGFDHAELFELLRHRDRWIMSYNDCDEIRLLYKGYRIASPEWKYGMSKDKKSKEVLIFG